MSRHSQTVTVRREDREIEVHVEVTSWGSPPRTNGPPECCDPGDPVEWEYTTDPPGIELTEVELEDVEERIACDPYDPTEY